MGTFEGNLPGGRWSLVMVAFLSACSGAQAQVRSARARDRLPPARGTAAHDIDADGIPDVPDEAVVTEAGTVQSVTSAAPGGGDGVAAARAKLPGPGAPPAQLKATEEKTTGAQPQ